jgi:RNA polymerase sigma factor FliA
MSLDMSPYHSAAPAPIAGGAGPDGESAQALLWAAWRGRGDEAARQQLLELHMPYARIVAASYYGKRMHNEIEFGDYLQLASIGLIEALDRFDPEVGVQFRTFAARRMHGALLDGIERLTEKQQQIAAQQRLQAQRRAIVRQGLAEGGEGAAKASRTSEQVLQYVAEAGLAFAIAWILDGTGMLDRSAKSETLPFYRSVELQQLRQRIVDIVNSLPPQERKVIHSHYFQEVPFDEIALSMQLTTGRISQVHRKALARLKDALRAQDDCDVSW